MRQTTLIFIYSLFFFVFSIKSFSKETGVLYLWTISDKEVWKKFGDEELHQKYNGEIINSTFSDDITLYLKIPYKNLIEFKKNINEKSKGTIQIIGS